MNIILGNIVRDAEIREVTNGDLKTQVTEFTVAENRTNRNGENHPVFWKISLWRDRGVKLKPFLTKGRPVQVQGDADAQPWIDKEGKPQVTMVMKNVTITFASGGKKADGEAEDEPEVTPAVPFEDTTAPAEAE